MRKEKVNNTDFVRQLSKESGYPMVDIKEIFAKAVEIIVRNLAEGKATDVMGGLVVYPSTYNGEVTHPRARFGKQFRNFTSLS